MTDARERLKRILMGDTQDTNAGDLLGQMADRLLAAGVTLAPEPPAPLKVWPGMEGDGLRRVLEVFDTAYDDGARRGLPADDLSRAARTAQTAYLWRALVASLPTAPTDVARECVTVGLRPVTRAALAALADPYDGGGKGEA